MSWDRRARETARTHRTALSHGTIAAKDHENVFARGAMWQRQQLQSWEAIEHVAGLLFTIDQRGTRWEDAAVEERPTYRGQARALLIDLIGGDS